MVDGKFDESWEIEYSKGEMINKYPFDILVALTFRYFGRVNDKSKIKVLDLGCGVGNNSWFFAREGFDLTGIDASRTAIEFAKKKFKSERLTGKFLNIRFDEINALNEKYDLIVDRESLYTIEWSDLTSIFSKIKDKMHDKSIFISFFYNYQHPDKVHCKATKNGRTFYNLENNAFGNTKRVTLLNENSVYELFSGFEIIELYNHRIEPLKTKEGGLGGIAEYIIVCKKGTSL